MPLRLYKVVVPVEHMDAFADYSKAFIQPALQKFTRPNGVRYFQADNSPLTFFLTVWWATPVSAGLFDESNVSKQLVAGIYPFLANRLVYWDLVILDDDYSPDTPVFFDHNVFLRLSKVSISQSSASEMIATFDRYTNSVTRKQPGCLSVKLLESTNVLDVYFIFTIWEKESDFQNFFESKAFKDLKLETLKFLEKRVEVWNVRLLANSDEVYKILGAVIKE